MNWLLSLVKIDPRRQSVCIGDIDRQTFVFTLEIHFAVNKVYDVCI